MIRSKLFWSAALCGLLMATSAHAETQKQSRECRYVNGVESCVLTTDYGDYTSKMTCDRPNGSLSDSTCSFDKKYNAPNRETARYNISDEDRKAAIRKASGYRDPPGTRELR